MTGIIWPWKEARFSMEYFLAFTKADGLYSDVEHILRESINERGWNRIDGSSWEISCIEINEENPNIASGTSKSDQES